MVWNQLKYHARHLNIFTSQPGKVVELIRNVCDQKITQEHWENYVRHVIKQEKEFREMDFITDNDIEPLVIHVSNESDSDGSDDEFI